MFKHFTLPLRIFILIVCPITSTDIFAFESAVDLSPEVTNGIYDLATPERSAAGQTQRLKLEYGEMNGQTVLVTASCEKCPAAGYRLLESQSSELGRPIFFNSAGIYVFAYDATTFVTAMATGELGKTIWKSLVYSNVYSKQGSASITLEQGVEFVLAESKRLMTGEGIAQSVVVGGNGLYYAAVKQTVGSQQYDQIEVTIYPEQKIVLDGTNCRSCSSDTYNFESELSQAIGKNVYEMGHMGRFLIEEDIGELWWTNTYLGKKTSLKTDNFNVITQDKLFARKLTIDKTLQSTIDSRINTYSTQAKAAVEARYKREDQQRTANNTLPKKGMKDPNLESETLLAAKIWAGSYRWKEELVYTYLVSRDWRILRHPVTGIQTGRRINGVITMKRDDGLCSYQAAIFEQAFNGIDYQKVRMVGVVPGQNKLDCGKL